MKQESLLLCLHVHTAAKQAGLHKLWMCALNCQVRPTNQRFSRVPDITNNVTDAGISETQVMLGEV